MTKIKQIHQWTGCRPLLIAANYDDDVYGERKDYAVREGIAVIHVSGPLSKESWAWPSAWGGTSNYDQIQAEVLDAAADTNIRGIVLRVDSPGGDTDGAYETADVIELASADKHVWAFADGGAYSAAYLLASAAQKLYVTPVTGGVGSIGVIARHFDFSKMLDKEGIAVTAIYEGERKDDFSPYKPLGKDAKASLAEEISRLYGRFVADVARRRKMSEESVRATEAGLFFADAAIAAGLADGMMPFRDLVPAMQQAIAAKAASATQLRKTGAKTMSQATEPEAKADTPVDIEAIRREASASANANTLAILDLCAIAGVPDKAAEFIRGGKTESEVRKSLLDMKAAADTAEIDTTHHAERPYGQSEGWSDNAGEHVLVTAAKARYAHKGGR